MRFFFNLECIKIKTVREIHEYVSFLAIFITEAYDEHLYHI